MIKTPKTSPITLDGMSHPLDKTCDCPTIFAVVIPMKMGLWQQQTLGQVPNGIAVMSVPNGTDTHTNTCGRLAARGTLWKEWATHGANREGNILFKTFRNTYSG